MTTKKKAECKVRFSQQKIMKKFILLSMGLLMCFSVAILKPGFHKPKNEPSAESSSQEERGNLENATVVVHVSKGTASSQENNNDEPNITDDFPEAAIPILESFRKIENEIRRNYDAIRQRAVMQSGGIIPTPSYVFYDVNKQIPSRNSMFFDRTIDIEHAYLEIVRKIVSEVDIKTFRLWMFISYGDFFPSVSSCLRQYNNTQPLSYEKFLLSVFLLLSDIKIGMPDSVYLPFVKEVLLPLSCDLAQKGPTRPPVVIDDAFIERMTRYVYQDRSKLPEWLTPTKYLISSFTFPEPIPHEILWSGIYRKIDHLIGAGYYKDPYYLFKYYRTLLMEEDSAVILGDALNLDTWCNYYVNSLIGHQLAEKVDEIETLMLNLRRCDDAF